MNRLLANYHTHTKRCGHATGEDREYIENAIKSGIKILGFSDHTPMPFPSGHHSGHRIPLDLADDYFYSLSQLKSEYKDDIEIHIGVETEYYPKTFDLYLEYMSQYPCEYMILGQHFIDNEENGQVVFSPTDDENILKAFHNNIIEAVKTGKFLYIAHPDVIKFTGPVEVYQKEAKRYIDEIKKYNIPIELNRLGLADNRHYPKSSFFSLIKDTDIPVVIGLDAHSPDVLLDKQSIENCYEFANKHNVKLIENNIIRL